MIISRAYVRRLERAGKARIERIRGQVVTTQNVNDGHCYALVTRFDLVRVDHYRVAQAKVVTLQRVAI